MNLNQKVEEALIEIIIDYITDNKERLFKYPELVFSGIKKVIEFNKSIKDAGNNDA